MAARWRPPDKRKGGLGRAAPQNFADHRISERVDNKHTRAKSLDRCCGAVRP